MSLLAKASAVSAPSDNNGIDVVKHALSCGTNDSPGLARTHTLNPCAEIFVPRILPTSNSDIIIIKPSHLRDPKHRSTKMDISNANNSKISIIAGHVFNRINLEGIRTNGSENFITKPGYKNLPHLSLPPDHDDSLVFFSFCLYCIALTLVLCINIIKPDNYISPLHTPHETDPPLIIEESLSTASSSETESLYDFNTGEDDHCVEKVLNNMRLKNINKLIIGHLNINSIRGKFEALKAVIKNNLDILVVSETKLDHTFPDNQFLMEVYRLIRQDRIINGQYGGGVIVFQGRYSM